MPVLSFSFNNDTYNSVIDLIEDIDLEKTSLKIECLKSFDDDDYYELDIEKDEYEITKLKFKSNDSDNYEVTFDAKITLSDDKWQKTDENFKKNAMDGLIEVEFNLEEDGELFIYEEGFVKDCDGQTELFVD
jgi:hypothetical protein